MSVAKHAIYYCLEYNVPVNSVCPTIKAVLKASRHTMYKDQVMNVKYSKKSTTPKVTVTYWRYKEMEEEGEDVTMTLIDFLVDYATGDLQINEPALF